MTHPPRFGRGHMPPSPAMLPHSSHHTTQATQCLQPPAVHSRRDRGGGARRLPTHRPPGPPTPGWEALLWDRRVEGRFPEAKELKQRVRDRVAPTRSLGHHHGGPHSVPPPAQLLFKEFPNTPGGCCCFRCVPLTNPNRFVCLCLSWWFLLTICSSTRVDPHRDCSDVKPPPSDQPHPSDGGACPL